jgi:mxaL protein
MRFLRLIGTGCARPFGDARKARLLLACALLALALAHPSLPLERPVYRYLFVLDITQSMNARDYRLEGWPSDRLGFVKASLARALHELPCGSEAGLGLFATQHTQVLLNPLEVCEHQAILADVLAHIDWRMAWAADSHIAQGLYTGLRAAAARGKETRLVFFSDGQQFPPEPEPPYFHGKRGEARGLVVGVGGAQPVPIPRLDQENRPLGYWEYQDLKDFLPPEAMPEKPQGNYLSRLDEDALRRLADIAGIGYLRLETPDDLTRALLADDLAAPRTVDYDIRWILALAALPLSLWPQLRRISPRGARGSRSFPKRFSRP